jgi:hypothetical protein
MRYALEFPDSEVRGVAADGGALRLDFSAAAVRDADGERGWLPSVRLVLDGAAPAGDLAHAFGKIAEGALRHDGRTIARPALPATLAGDLELTLRFANGTLLAAHGRMLTLAVADDARFAPDLSC